MPNDKLALITGGSRGLGFATAEKLANRGFRTVLTARDQARAEEAAQRIRARLPSAQVEGRALELSSLANVREFSKDFLAREKRLDALVCNAGVLFWGDKERHVNADGHELTFATNYLGHFLLATSLLPRVREAKGRVVLVSSRVHMGGRGMHRGARFDFDDIDLDKGYDPGLAYANSKLALIWLAYEMQRQIEGTGVTANAICPGFLPEAIAGNTKGFQSLLMRYVMPLMPFARRLSRASEEVAQLAADPTLEGVGGKFFADGKESRSSEESYDVEKAKRLWALSEKLVAAGS